jgi:multidrug resistance efflux pump
MDGMKKVVIFSVLTVMVLAMAGIGLYYWFQNTYFVATEDAKVDGDIVRVSPQITGKLLQYNIEEGQRVEKDQILGQQEMINLPNANLEMALLRAPISGIVIKKQGTVGETVTPGQTLAMLIDPGQLFITANIEETKLEKLKPGQSVEISIDQFPGEEFSGKVQNIGLASASSFSLLPASTGGAYTKVVQKVSLKIQLLKNNARLLIGTNAVIKIHIK